MDFAVNDADTLGDPAQKKPHLSARNAKAPTGEYQGKVIQYKNKGKVPPCGGTVIIRALGWLTTKHSL